MEPTRAAGPRRTADRQASPGMGASLRVLSVGGIDVFVHVSWLVIFLLITWSLGTSYFPAAVPDATDAQHFILGAVAAVLLLVSVLLHELAHSFVAKARGLGVHSITLFIFGGVSNLAGEAKRPGTEFQIAIVGPLTSFAIAVVAFLVAESVDVAPVAAVAGYLAAINVLLGVFNLVPGFPLDGGRVLRSIVWSATGSLQRATDIAAGAGTLVAWGLMLLGFWRLLNGDVFGGLWMAAIGWFLQNAAETSQRQTRVESQLRNLRVRDVANRSATPADAATSVAELIERYILPGGQRAVPIVSGDRLLGIVTLSDVARVPVEDRGRTTAAEIMSGPDSLVTVTPETPLRDAVERLAQGDFEQLPVVDGGRLLGLLTRADVVGLLQIRAALGIGEEEGRRTRARA